MSKSKQEPWRNVLPIHPAADMLPLMTPEQLQEHADDIAKNGLIVPATLTEHVADDGKHTVLLLDGRNSLDALALLGCKIFPTQKGGGSEIIWRGYVKCKKINDGRPFPVFEFKYPDDPYAYVISRNIKRRQLNSDQKREALEKLLKIDPEKSNRAIAAVLGVAQYDRRGGPERGRGNWRNHPVGNDQRQGRQVAPDAQKDQ